MRVVEQRAAADVLGVGEIVHLGYPDGYLQPTLELRRDIVRQIRLSARPGDRAESAAPRGRQPVHRAPGPPCHRRATLAAVYPAARDRLNFPELLDEGLEPWKVRQVLVSGVERPNLWVDVSATLQRGLQALRCHESQIDDWDQAEASPRARCRVGQPVGMPMAQAFLSILLT